jgi:hypothetical protein
MKLELRSQDLTLVTFGITLVATLAVLLKGEAAPALDSFLLDGLHYW